MKYFNRPEIQSAYFFKIFVIPAKKFCNFARSKNRLNCGCGVIGSRARLRIWFRKKYGFESLHPH